MTVWKTFGIRLTEEEYEWLSNEAKKYDLPMTEVARLSLRQALGEGLDIPDEANCDVLDFLLGQPKHKTFTAAQIARELKRYDAITVRHILYSLRDEGKAENPRMGQWRAKQ